MSIKLGDRIKVKNDNNIFYTKKGIVVDINEDNLYVLFNSLRVEFLFKEVEKV